MNRLSPADKDFIAIMASQGVDLTERDMLDLHRLQFEATQRARARLLVPDEPAHAKGFAPFLLAGLAAAAGAFFLPGAIAGIGVLQGALLGAALGYQLGKIFFSKRRREDPQESPLFEFSGVGDLAKVNEPIPSVYANRSINPSGGVVFSSPPAIWSRVLSVNGAQELRRLFLLSVGRLGAVNEAEHTLDQQRRSLFGLGDIETAVNLGIDHEPAPTDSAEYSQAVKLNTNSFLGLDRTIERALSAATYINPLVFATLTNMTYDDITNTLTKSGGGGGFDARAKTDDLSLDSKLGSFINVECFRPVTDQAVSIGIADAALGLGFGSVGVGFNIRANGTFSIVLDGVTQPTNYSYVAGDNFKVRYYRSEPGPQIMVLHNNLELFRAESDLSDDVFAMFLIATASGQISPQVANTTGITPGDGQVAPGVGRRFLAAETGDIDISLLYRFGSQDLKIVDKTSDYIEFQDDVFLPEIEQISPAGGASGSIFAGIYRASYESSKPVTALELTLKLSLYARDKDGSLITHGMAWEVTLERRGEAEVSIYKMFAKSRREKGGRRTFTINNLPKDYYTVRLSPLSAVEIVGDVREIGDGSDLTQRGTGVDIEGQQIRVLINDLGAQPAADIIALIDQQSNSKKTTSNEQGPTGTLTHVNELVSAPGMALAYPGFSVGFSGVIASDRIQSAPTEGWQIDEGVICRQYLAQGTTTNTSTASTIDDVNAHFLDEGLVVGDRVRILAQRRQRVITKVSQYSLTCTERSGVAVLTAGTNRITVQAGLYGQILPGMPIDGTGIRPYSYVIDKIDGDTVLVGDEWGRPHNSQQSGASTLTFNTEVEPELASPYVAFALGSSPYFPDIYVDRLINPVYGLGNYIDQDNFIDYESIVYAREFCAAREFFYEAIVLGDSFEQWATEAAPASMLFVTMINGRYGLIPESNEPVSAILNAFNLHKYSEPYVPWIEQQSNSMLVKFSDQAGKDQQVKIMTPQAANGSESEVAQTTTLKGCKSRAQAIYVGKAALNSLRLQNRVCSFEGDVSLLNVRQGQIVQTQHVISDYNSRSGGRVMSAGERRSESFAATAPTAAIKSVIDGGGRTIVVCDNPHQLREGDRVEVVGSTGIDGIYAPVIQSPERFAIARSFTASEGGQVARYREVFNQTVVLSEVAGLSETLKIAIGSEHGAQVDVDLVDNGTSLVAVGLDTEVKAGDVYILGKESAFDRSWRISSVEPDVLKNIVKCGCVLWSTDIQDQDNLVVIE